eukprot:scaffold27971_cov66-Skeletonema_marinoi.AAC.1
MGNPKSVKNAVGTRVRRGNKTFTNNSQANSYSQGLTPGHHRRLDGRTDGRTDGRALSQDLIHRCNNKSSINTGCFNTLRHSMLIVCCKAGRRILVAQAQTMPVFDPVHQESTRAKSQANKGVLSFASIRDLGVCERTIMYVGIVQAKTPRSTGQNFR